MIQCNLGIRIAIYIIALKKWFVVGVFLDGSCHFQWDRAAEHQTQDTHHQTDIIEVLIPTCFLLHTQIRFSLIAPDGVCGRRAWYGLKKKKELCLKRQYVRRRIYFKATAMYNNLGRQ